jgi:rhodanese-related sulfurtransferase
MKLLRMIGLVSLLVGVAIARAAEPAAAPAQAPVPARAAAPPGLSASALRDRLAASDEVVVVDVRTAAEFAAGHVPGARNIPHDQVAARLPELAGARDKTVVLYCRSGRRSALAAQTMREAGFSRLLQLEGDYPGWEAGGHPVERAPPAPAALTN